MKTAMQREYEYARLYKVATEVADECYEDAYPSDAGDGSGMDDESRERLREALDILDRQVRPVLYELGGGEWEPHMEREPGA